jgi:hypothetical protein
MYYEQWLRSGREGPDADKLCRLPTMELFFPLHTSLHLDQRIGMRESLLLLILLFHKGDDPDI